jgi:hypothetical protein
MTEYLGEVLKGLKEILEWSKAPGEFASLVASLSGSQNERVLDKGYARYLNTERLLDRPLGIYLVTNERFLFLTKKKMLPWIKGTEHLILQLQSLERAEATKYRLATALRLVTDKKDYLFLITNMLKFTTKEQVNEVAQLVTNAKLGC